MWIIKLIHFHRFYPLISKYWSFETRKIIYQCGKCGKKKEIKFYSNYYSGSGFPIQTTNFIDDYEYERVLESKTIFDRPYVPEIFRNKYK